MSYNFDGKIVNQMPRFKNYTSAKCSCAKCEKVIDSPKRFLIKTDNNKHYIARSYLDSSFFIYETKSGRSVTYCSKYCRNKHNHRFKK